MRFFLLTIWLFVGLVLVPGSTSVLNANEPVRLALLVGCTRYPLNTGLRELHGPVNDVAMWANLLTDSKGFGFALQDVLQLTDWPLDEKRRPTYANIVNGFESLIARAEVNSRVVILLSGHGVQIPIPTSQADPLDPRNPEPDGLDEVFLAADVKNWNEISGLENSIVDDQIGVWLDRLRNKGAHVLIVFDCCHSGTMTRGGPDVREISRVASTAALGISTQALHAAVKRANSATSKMKQEGQRIPGDRVTPESVAPTVGSLAAFYAAQPFEEAPELPFPSDTAAVSDNYFGLLSWTLVETLRARQSALSYRELERLLATRIRSTRGVRPPTPFAEGDLNREVLGLTVWPRVQEVLLTRTKQGQFQLDAGVLHGISMNSILSIHPPLNDRRPSTSVLGYVKVTAVRPTDAAVAFVRPAMSNAEFTAAADWEEDTTFDVTQIPDSCRCEIVFQDFGDMRLPIFSSDVSIQSAIARLPNHVRQLLRIVSKEDEAAWVLRVVTPRDASVEYQLTDLKSDEVVLIQGNGQARQGMTGTLTSGQDARVEHHNLRKVFGRYSLEGNNEIQHGLAQDMPKIFKWTNLWRIAGKMNSTDGGEGLGIHLEMLAGDGQRQPQGLILQDRVLRNGQEVMFQVRHEGTDPLWISAFYLDANLRIQSLLRAGIKPGQTLKLAQATMTTENNSYGLEGIIVFALPQATVAIQPNFSMLEQEPLNVPEKLTRRPKSFQDSPFDRLLNEAAFRSGVRGIHRHLPSTPSILALPWLLLP